MLHGIPVLRISRLFFFKNILIEKYILFQVYLEYENIMAALREPNRLYIVELLRDGPLIVGEITRRSRLQQPQVSKYLKVLSEAAIKESNL